jgi:hypothetical protein
MSKNRGKGAERQEQARKAYSTPRLVEYGKIAKLTKGSVGAKGDGATKRT